MKETTGLQRFVARANFSEQKSLEHLTSILYSRTQGGHYDMNSVEPSAAQSG